MLRGAVAAFFLLLALLAGIPTQAQEEKEPPYLYYYSKLLGGLIIERADGTDSRHLAADALPSSIGGIAGPGWSPSGRFFAAYGVTYGPYTVYHTQPILIRAFGESVTSWLGLISRTHWMQWSPTGEDLLLIVGSHHDNRALSTLSTFFWLIDAETGQLLADFGVNLASTAYDMSEITWDVPHEQIVFTLQPNTYDVDRIYRVTMRFDGTTLREPIDASEFRPRYQGFIPDSNSDDLYMGLDVSPSGTYETLGVYPAIMTNTRTGEAVELPVHTEGTICRGYIWSDDEAYIITLNGTLRAGGGCGTPVLGVTDSDGALWRELGGCSWDAPPCVGWLPERVDVNSLPPRLPEPIQLDPARIDYDSSRMESIVSPETTQIRLRCGERSTADILNIDTSELLYQLTGVSCPYNPGDSFAEEGLRTVVAYHPVHDLLATYHGYFETGTSVWALRNGLYERVLVLNTLGYQLEFTDDGNYLRARNVHGWKVYKVADILAVAQC